MSYDIHEAYSLDSFQDSLLFWEDFEGDSIKDLWNTVGTGTVAVVDQQDGGIVRLSTGATTAQTMQIHWNTIRSLLVSKKVTIEWRVKLNNTASMIVLLQLLFNATNRIRFIYTAGGNWFIYTRDAGGITQADSGIAADTDEHIFRIECFPTDEVHFYIDDVETANSPLTTNIPTDYLEPVMFIVTNEDVDKSMDIDYVYIRQDR